MTSRLLNYKSWRQARTAGAATTRLPHSLSSAPFPSAYHQLPVASRNSKLTTRYSHAQARLVNATANIRSPAPSIPATACPQPCNRIAHALPTGSTFYILPCRHPTAAASRATTCRILLLTSLRLYTNNHNCNNSINSSNRTCHIPASAAVTRLTTSTFSARISMPSNQITPGFLAVLVAQASEQQQALAGSVEAQD